MQCTNLLKLTLSTLNSVKSIAENTKEFLVLPFQPLFESRLKFLLCLGYLKVFHNCIIALFVMLALIKILSDIQI